MRFSIRTSLGFILFCSVFAAGQTQPQTTPNQEPPTLADIARQYQERKLARETAPAVISGAQSAISPDNQDIAHQYEAHIKQLFAQANFDELEKKASEVRSSKARFPGGGWKLYTFYLAINYPKYTDPATEADWNARLMTLKNWVAAKPQSITARLAVAEAQLELAWKARGGGYANTVTEEGWGKFEKSVEKAKAVLIEAKKLKEQCPYWYSLMQTVALAQGWEKADARALFDEAASFEPKFYYYYQEYASFLAPKWYGEEGEAEQFGKEAADRIGGAEGAIVYFEVASTIHCPCSATDVHELHMSWPRIQEGYKALTQLYGTSRLKENRFAYMAYLAKDKTVARDVFTRIGADWEPTLWRKRQSFETVRLWAMSQ